MRHRALVHVAGPAGAGKTTFVERLLDAEAGFAICVRAERDSKLRKERESAPKTHAELRRYREAGASAAALYRFPEPDTDAFFTTDFMQDYSEAVFIEGDCPIEYVDVSVFVAPRPRQGRSLLRREQRDRKTAHRASIEQLAQALEGPAAMARFLGVALPEKLVARALAQPAILGEARRSMASKLSELRRAPAPAAEEHWTLEPGYAGIESAQLVVVNVRSDADRSAASRLIDDVARMRKDEAVFLDVIGLRGSRSPITAVIADLSNPKDAGLRNAVARVKRATQRSMP